MVEVVEVALGGEIVRARPKAELGKIAWSWKVQLRAVDKEGVGRASVDDQPLLVTLGNHT